ncbi:hypothetical protein MKW92_047166 [Papaver armeniacum]|nr:hypothetical protein MKW92_047166 [Papaver armeniacum]
MEVAAAIRTRTTTTMPSCSSIYNPLNFTKSIPISRLSRSQSSSSRYFHLFSSSVSSFLNLHSNFNKQTNTSKFIVRNSTTSSSSNNESKFQQNLIRTSQRKPNNNKDIDDDKLIALRQLFSKPGIGIDAYIIPSQDAYQSEFIAECFSRRAYISGFTGSAGTAVVTRDKACSLTDGRYFLQAEKQLSPSWILMRAGNYGVPTTTEWLNDVLDPGCRVGIDPFLFSSNEAEEIKEEISKHNHELVPLYDINLVDQIWKESRPKPPMEPIRVHEIRYAGVHVSSKLSNLRSDLIEAGCSAIVITMLDEIAWLLNLFWSWLEEEIHKGVVLTEVEVSDKLLEFRAKQDGFLDTSFDTISGSGANGAIIHYKPEPESCDVVDAKKLFLLDSGGQYIDGTTDITRTVHFGEPTTRQKECFTRVLQGHIAVDQAVFPENTPGFVLDALARSALWKVGLDYRHGTGHGVGAALNVHEGPQSISFRFGNMTPLQKGMVVSNEPGYYEDHSFGIRIENLLVVKEINTPNHFGGIGYLGFENITFVPIQAKLVDLSLMSAADVDWLNDYHSQVWKKVSFIGQGAASKWLWDNTQPLVKP